MRLEANEPVFHHSWEAQVFAMSRVLGAAGIYSADEFRYFLEQLPPVEHLLSSYYDRMLRGLEHFAAADPVTPPENPEAERATPSRFHVGNRVRTKNINPATHTRLPRYARGKAGVIDLVHDQAPLPDVSAHRHRITWEPVYTVVFEARELWGRAAHSNERVSIDLWQSYLEEKDY